MLLPVLLLAGLAKKLFAPLALTVAVAMIASYLISMFVTPVACRFFLSDKEPHGIGKRLGDAIDRVADGYARLLRRALGVRIWIIGVCAASDRRRGLGSHASSEHVLSRRSTNRWSASTCASRLGSR